ncbi:hypothetical protein Tco_1501088 [Tanacetum coccineum]
MSLPMNVDFRGVPDGRVGRGVGVELVDVGVGGLDEDDEFSKTWAGGYGATPENATSGVVGGAFWPRLKPWRTVPGALNLYDGNQVLLKERSLKYYIHNRSILRNVIFQFSYDFLCVSSVFGSIVYERYDEMLMLADQMENQRNAAIYESKPPRGLVESNCDVNDPEMSNKNTKQLDVYNIECTTSSRHVKKDISEKLYRVLSFSMSSIIQEIDKCKVNADCNVYPSIDI